ncbi:hypothetical protein CMT41_03805 [Colwellia sp. MT41]|uniref:hypothetical protein n=1 Tax=Colwellia sp. MT41 TaxID=58049 RepID=UPI0007176D6A|nr:hypothetical protein [Colwellia sp. MT41]ALO33949.1 hypothetical protein CMT41_03805 [Colwellia sp. MT41]
MNKVIKVLSLVLVLTSSVYLPSAFAASTTNTTEMLITLAETDPVLIDRLNDIALTDKKLLKQLLNMAESEPVKLERLLNLAERNAHMFWMIANIYNAQSITLEQPVEEQPFSTFGAIQDGGGIIRN